MNPIEAFHNTLELKTRDDGTTFITSEDEDSIDLLRDLDYNIVIIDLAQKMTEYDLEDLEDCLHEIAESQVDIYYHEIAEYVASNPDVLFYEVQSCDESKHISQLVQRYQSELYSEICHQIYNHFEDEINEYLEGQE
ncbi:MAG: hypothetical protein Unbinned8472contig1000_50 [Prokaryotic dsDNA virus sp.]|nr:MAG: hypothetical protein Unbinned8472contig1000_50 [Prokaryotic dsDNA virus sp.]|tara:strand:+ start:53117 stop:53527 length:411 start_codon:yes stop_codon:yes gene_type:complete